MLDDSPTAAAEQDIPLMLSWLRCGRWGMTWSATARSLCSRLQDVGAAAMPQPWLD